jgi:uncharacterized protein
MPSWFFLRAASQRLCLLLVGALLLVGGCQSPAPTPSAVDYLTAIPDPKTLGETYVSDPNSRLASATVLALNTQLDSLDRSGRAHIDVVLVNSIGEAVPKTAATALFNKWKIGRKDTDNGLLMLLVLDQRRIEFETGYGLEGDLPDIICYRIQQRYMVPALRAGHYDQAVQRGVAAIIRHLRPAAALPKPVLRTAADSTRYYVDSLKRAIMAQNGMLADEDPLNTALPGEALTPDYYVPPTPGPPIGTLVGAVLALVLYLVLWYRTTQGLRGRGWLVLVPVALVAALAIPALQDTLTSGLFLGLIYGLPLLYLHGYFGWQYWRGRRAVPPAQRPAEHQRLAQAHRGLGFTAYLFPVGLLFYWRWYRQWISQLRQAPLACPTCGEAMHQLDQQAAQRHLEPGQQTEQAVRSVSYDVWACPSAHYLPLGYPNLDSETTTCPACHYRTLGRGRLRPVQVATTTAAGWGWRVQKCHFCQHEEKTRETIPQRSAPASSSSSGSASSSWGSSSGSSSGSRSSSSSTSSGGSSGGGGAGSSW